MKKHIYKIIKPHIGVDDIRFGMTQNEINKLLGPPDAVIINDLHELEEFRENMTAIYSNSTEPKLVEMGFNRRCSKLSLNNIKLFEPPYKQRLSELYEIDGCAFIDVGTVVFKNIGISTSGFLDNVIDDIALTIFETGRWDDIIIEMNPFVDSK